jgi:hypothetical protein
MPKTNSWLMATAITLAAFALGRWSNSATNVRADSAGNPQIEVRPIGGDSSLTVYYPSINRLFVYQNPFVGLPTWPCAYSIQLSEPGGKVERKPCAN